MTRLFFAIELPEAAELDLGLVEEGIPDARFTFGLGLHLTLAFLGDCSRAETAAAMQVGRYLAWSPFELHLSGVGAFPLRGSPKVLWIGAKKSPPLFRLQQSLTRHLRSEGFELEKRKFRPHVTLARVGESPRGRVASWIERHIDLEVEPFLVRRIALFESVLTNKGAHYRVLEEFRANRPYEPENQ